MPATDTPSVPAETQALTEVLRLLQADSQVLYMKTRAYHWNVKGPGFFTLHTQFEAMYTRLALRIDEIAERMIDLQAEPIPTFAKVLATSRLREDPGHDDANAMVHELKDDSETMTGFIEAVAEAADAARDRATVALMDEMAAESRKDAWMLRSYLGA